MDTVRLSFTLERIEDDLAPTESQQEVRAFLDARFTREPPTPIPLGKGAQLVQVQGSYPRRLGAVSPTAALALAAFATRGNEFGAPCVQSTGTAHLALAELLAGGPGFTRDIPLVMHTTRSLGVSPDQGETGVVKSVLRFTLRSADAGGVRINRALPSLLGAPAAQLQNALLRYINSTIALEQRMGDTIGGTDRVRCPFDYSESGIELTGNVPLPAVAYALFETPPTNVGYWENAFSRVMARDGLSVHDWSTLKDPERARATALTVVYPVQYLDYVSDTVDRNRRHTRYQARLKQGYENFGDALTTWSGDCEDLASAIAQMWSALQRQRFPEGSPLEEMQRISAHYLPLLSLDVVHGQKVADENAPKGAHMNLNLVPIAQFRAALRRSAGGEALDARLPWDEQVREIGEKAEEKYPMLVGEGTGESFFLVFFYSNSFLGMYEPLGFIDSLLPIRRYVYGLPSLAGFKKPITHERGADSTFFLGSMVGFTNYFLDRGANVGGFVYGTLRAPTADAPNGRITRGALYTALVRNERSLAFVPQPPVPAPVMEAIREATLLRVPPNALILDEKRPPRRNPHLDAVVRAVRKVGRQSRQGSAAVPIYVRPHQLDMGIAEQMGRELASLERVHAVTYEEERITNTLSGFRLMVHVNPEQ